jgi:riboflavin transporter FmnP
MVAALTALIIRAIVAVFFNFYFALPIFFGMTPEMIFSFFSALKSFVSEYFGLIGLGAYIAEISIWNIIQGVVDLSVSFVVGNIVLRRLIIREDR